MILREIKELLDIEIGFHSEIENPWYWQWICRLFGKRECHEVLINELLFLKEYLEIKPTRLCADCGEPFDCVDATDWWCKPCLKTRYESTRPKPEITAQKEPEMTQSGPGGS